MPINEKPLSFAIAMNDAMKRLDLSLLDLSKRLDLSYEHIRKLHKGEAIPADKLIPDLCEALDLSIPVMRELCAEERMRKKFGSLPEKLAGKNLELAAIEKKWSKLTPNEKRLVRGFIDLLLKPESDK